MTQYIYVNTGADPGGDGTTRALTGANCAYDTLADAEPDIPATLTEDVIIRCAGGLDTVTGALVFDGFNSVDVAWNVEVRADDGEDDSAGGGDNGSGYANDGWYKGKGQFSTSHYRITYSGFDTIRPLAEVHFYGIQADNTKASPASTVIGAIQFNCHFNSLRITTDQGGGIVTGSGSWKNSYIQVSNCLIWSADPSPSGDGIGMWKASAVRTGPWNIYNNTILGGFATGILHDGDDHTGDTYTLKNNVVHIDGGTEYTNISVTNATLVWSNCAGDDAEPSNHGTGWVALGTDTDEWEDPTEGRISTSDWTPKSTGGLADAGTSGNPEVEDLIRNTPSTTTPEIGCLEITVSGVTGIGDVDIFHTLADGTGQVLVDGTGNVDIFHSLADGSGAVLVEGVGDTDIFHTLSDGTGSVQSGVDGVGDTDIHHTSVNATGAVLVAGVADVDIHHTLSTGAGEVLVSGVGDVDIFHTLSDGTGAVTDPGEVTGIADVDVFHTVSSGAGQVLVTGVGDVDVHHTSVTAAGQVLVDGTADVDVFHTLSAGTGAVTSGPTGVGDADIFHTLVDGTGAVLVAGTGASSIFHTSVTGAGAVIVTGIGAVQVFHTSASGAGSVLNTIIGVGDVNIFHTSAQGFETLPSEVIDHARMITVADNLRRISVADNIRRITVH